MGLVEGETFDSLEQHVLGCEGCVETISALNASDTLVQAVQSQPEVTRQLAPFAALIAACAASSRRFITLSGEEPTSASASADEPTSAYEPTRPISGGVAAEQPTAAYFAAAAAPPPDDAEAECYDFLAPSQAADELGRLAGYRLLRVLGAGGMGTVFEAEDVQLKRRLALKVMKPALAASRSSRQRFLREAQTAAAVEHDHIVPIYQVGEDRGTAFIAMPLLRGESLAERLAGSGDRSEPLPVAEVLRVSREIATGLDAAHRAGLIHRDIKPGNIWLEERTGRVKLLDFGLARAVDGGEQLTNAGALLGTPSYMAPEQARGDAVDTRADLFSLGCVIYQMAVGRRPFEGRDALSTLLAVGTQPARPPREINPELPEAIERLILRLLEKDPAERVQSAAELIAEIRALESAPQQTQLFDVSSGVRGPKAASVATSPQPAIRSADKPPRNVRRLAIAAAAAAAACILCGVIVIKIKHRDGTEDTITVRTQKGESVDINLSDEEQPVENEPSADGSRPQAKIENQAPWRGWSADVPAPAVAPFDAAQAKKHQQEWADHLKAPLEYVNSIGMKLVLIPPGEFLMGSTDEQIEAALKAAGEDAADQRVKDLIEKGQRPQHKVIISKPFSMGATEVTVGQFRKFIEATKYVTEAEKYGFGDSMFVTMNSKITDAQKQMNWRTPGYALTDELPATQITWNDAQAFCRWLSTQEKAAYRLPTEAEWEYACRGGTTTQFSFGDDHVQLDQYGWFVGNSNGAPRPVGTKLPNAFLFDTHGSLWEWCSDVFDENWYENSPSVDPTGPSSGRVRVLRGGFWAISALLCRSTTRNSGSPSWRNNYIGFRCVKALDVPPTQAAAIHKTANHEGEIENPKSAPAWRGWPADGPEPAIAPFDAAQAKKHQQQWADYLELPLEYTNSIGIKFVLIPPGEFTMGSTAEVIDEAMKVVNRIVPDNKFWHEFVPSEAPPHKVVISRPFYLSVFEVTQKEYETVMGVNPSTFAKTNSGEAAQKVAGLDTTAHPVENVRWNDAVEFCAKLLTLA